MKKKINIYFIGECVIIFLLLIVIGILLKDKDANIQNTAAAIESQNQPADDIKENTEENTVGLQAVTETKKESNVVEISGQVRDVIPADSLTQISSVLAGKKVVVFGDSIWNDARGEDGISEQLMELTGCTVYNCAIGGTSAAVVGHTTNFSSDWSDWSFNGMVYVANDLLSADAVLGGTEACDVIKEVDFNTVDYILVSYGLNDFFSEVSIYPNSYYDISNYVGALRNGVHHLKENYPQATIVLVTPTYTKLFEAERELHIGDYVEAMRSVSVEMETELADMFHILGDDPDSRIQHLDDGVHLSEEGRNVYANGIAWYLTEIENEKIAEAEQQAEEISAE